MGTSFLHLPIVLPPTTKCRNAEMPVPSSLSGGVSLCNFPPAAWGRLRLLISPCVGAACNAPLWDTVESWHTLTSWEPLRTKRWLEQSQWFERQIGAQAGLIDEVHLLHRPILSRRAEVAAWCDVQKPTQVRKMKAQGDMFQTKGHDKHSEI